MVDIKFNVPPYVDKAADYIQECVKNQKICGDGEYTRKNVMRGSRREREPANVC